MSRDAPTAIEVTRLSSGWWHIRGVGPCNWSQPPEWPCDEDALREYAHPEAGDGFISEALKEAGREHDRRVRRILRGEEV